MRMISRLLGAAAPLAPLPAGFVPARLRDLEPGRDGVLESSRPCCSSYLAMRDCSLRSSLSRWDSTFARRDVTSGCISESREDWAAEREDSDMSSKCCGNR
jgi:hypothetical protein